MKLANPRIESLKELIVLEEKRIAIQGQLDAIEARIAVVKDSIFTGSPITSSSASASSPKVRAVGRPPGSKNSGKGGARGTYREYIMSALEAAGEAGVQVKELALAMKTKPVNIHSWFHSNIKRIPSIKKITGGHYRLAGGAKAVAAAKAAKPAKGRKTGKRGALRASIMEHLKTAGAGGIKIADLADKLGAKYKNVYIWFATTGKKNPNIQRIAPATYQLKS